MFADLLHDAQVVDEGEEVAAGEVGDGFLGEGVDGVSELVDLGASVGLWGGGSGCSPSFGRADAFDRRRCGIVFVIYFIFVFFKFGDGCVDGDALVGNCACPGAAEVEEAGRG